MKNTRLKCKNCNKKHSKKYGSGKYCSLECSKKGTSKLIGLRNIEYAQKNPKEMKQRAKKAWETRRKGGNPNVGNKKPIECHLVSYNKTRYTNTRLKKRLIEEKILPEICAVCRLKNVWNNKKLVLILDHIDGNRLNNSLSNLRLICPNCNSQTDTFAGRNRKNKRRKI